MAGVERSGMVRWGIVRLVMVWQVWCVGLRSVQVSSGEFRFGRAGMARMGSMGRD
jgi:hypothetical protein